MWSWTLLVLATCLHSCMGYRILAVFPMPVRSHSILGDGIVRNLLEHGHDVTYVTAFPRNSTNPKLHEIDVSENLELFPQEELNLGVLIKEKIDTMSNQNLLALVSNLQKVTLKNENVQKLVNDPNATFDVVILQWIFSEGGVGYSAIFGCPFIYFSTTEYNSAVLKLMDEFPNPFVVPSLMSTNKPPMTFIQRLQELWDFVKIYILRTTFIRKADLDVYENHFAPIVKKRGQELPPFDDLRFNASLMLANSHVSLGGSASLPQAYKDIGGFHIDPNVKPIPEDLRKILDNSKNGFIYFSMGSNLRSKDWPLTVKQDLLKMFGSLKYTVIWKFEEELPNVPKNVHILKWAPQQSILNHPNCFAFISHGGQLSTTEALHFGVPIIGIPVYGDQFNNVDRVAKKGFAYKVELTTSLVEDLNHAIDEFSRNPKYKETAKALSLVYHDRPVPPGKELTHWVEHVIKTRGAPHLRSPSLLVPWYQKMFLDMAAILLVVLIVLKKLLTALLRRKTVDLKKKNK